jgi:outer membrane protein assembly factor BamB
MYARRFLLLPLAAALVAGLLTAADWTRFRGPNGTGIVADKDVPVKWTEKEVLWKTPLPGTGHSSPIVVKGKVFVLTATSTERMLVCLDAGSGKKLWAKTAAGRDARKHTKSSFASATPCSDGERIYCVFWDGRRVALYAYDFAGELKWKRDLGAFTSQHGPGFSPVFHDGKVFVNNDQDGSAVLQAFHAKDGKPAWEVKRPAFRACYSTPFLHEQGPAGTELIVTSTAGISAYNPADGAEVWKFTWSFTGMALRTVGSSVAADGMVIACSGDGSGARSMIAVKIGSKGDITRGNPVWEKDTPRGTPYVPCVLAHQGHLYTINDDGTAICYETKTGNEMWRKKLMDGNVSSSPLLIDGKVYAVAENGDVHVFPATPEGCKPLAKNRLGELVYSTPAVVGGRLYVRGGKHLFCIGKPGSATR